MSRKLSAKYYQENKERLQKKKACGKYQNLFKEKKGKKQQNGCESYKICKKMKNKSLLSIKQ